MFIYCIQTREDKMVEATTEGVINRFHYRWTTLFLLVSCLLVTCSEWISGTDSIIDCIHGESMPNAVVNMYCYISVRIRIFQTHLCYEAKSIFREHSAFHELGLMTTL